MKLLLDENISRRIVPALQDKIPGSSQVALVGLEQATDHQIWEFARVEKFVIVTRDKDFRDMAQLLGFPPKIILLGLGNCSNQRVLHALTNGDGLVEALASANLGVIEFFD